MFCFFASDVRVQVRSAGQSKSPRATKQAPCHRIDYLKHQQVSYSL
jgi:hypothetical protein